jgi:transposase
VGQEGLASSKKNARRLKAHLVFLDESGLMMAPLVRRTWAPRGQTPVLYQRTRSHQKVSAIAALTLSPRVQRVGLYFLLLPNQNVTSVELIGFLRQLRQQLRGRIVLVWDRLLAHRSRAMNAFLAGQQSITVEYLPPYAPELNPVELVWSYLKTNPLANLAPHDVEELTRVANRSAKVVQADENLLRAFLEGTPLFSCLR